MEKIIVGNNKTPLHQMCKGIADFVVTLTGLISNHLEEEMTFIIKSMNGIKAKVFGT